MRKLKKWLSMMLATVMTLSLCTTPMLAATTAYDGDHSGSISVTVRDSYTGNAISGATVQLEDLTAGRYQTYDLKTTSTSGTVTWTNLSSGQYRISEISVPNTHVLDTKSQTIWLDTEETSNAPVTIYNVAKSALYIYRFDPDPDSGYKPLAGAEFKVVSATSNQVVATGTTDASGYFVVPNLPDGEYLITETKAPSGYAVTNSSRSITIASDGSGTPYVVEFCGDELSSIAVILRDSETGEPIPNATFEVRRADTTQIASNLTTNAAGMVYITNLTAGTYQIIQTSVADGYINKLVSTQVTLTNETTKQIVTLYNTPYGSITVNVSDSVTTNALPGTTFTLYDSDNKVVQGPIQAGTDGRVTFANVAPGNYTVVATAPTGYVMDTVSITVPLTGGSNVTIPFTATEKGTITISSIDASDPSKPIPGTSFTVKKMDGTLVGTYTTGADGTATVTSLDNGYYLIEETDVPNGYVMVSATKTVQVTAGQVTPVTFYNRARPYIIVETVVQGTTIPISGSVVVLTDSTGTEVGRTTTDANGQAIFEDLAPGTYTARYSSAPKGYTIEVAAQQVVVTTSVAGMATLSASRNSAIVIEKLDTQNQNPLSGATFQVRDSLGQPVAFLTTGADGTAVTDTLTPGRYTIQEMFAPDGYVPDVNARTVTVRNNETSTEVFTNTQKTSLVVYAYGKSGEPLANVPYIVYEADTGKEVAQILTNESGVATTDKLDPGLYMVTEATIPEDYTLVNPTQSHILLQAGSPSYVRFVHVAKAYIQIQTVAASDGTALAGAVYQVMSDSGDYKANFTVDENGEAQTGYLAPGIYTVKQIVAPDGYLLNTTTQTITVLKNEVKLAKFFNKQMSRIEIQCVVQGSEFGLDGCTFTVEDSTGKEVYHGTTDNTGTLTTGELTPGRYTVKQIAVKDGYSIVQRERTVDVTLNEATTVKFEQVALTSIIIHLTDVDEPTKGLAGAMFTIETIDGKFVTEVTTDAAGKAITEALPVGKYEVHQTTATAGYLLSQTYQWATVSAGQAAVLEFTNAKISGLVIQCLLESDHSGLAGGVFEIYHQNGKLVKTVTSDATGVIDVGELEPDVYLIKEVTVPGSYTARTLTQTVTITTNEPTTVTFYHTAESVLTVNLKDEQTGDVLANGVFRVYKANGDLVGEYTTNASGQFVISTLAAGTYTVEQITAPDGYVIDTTPKYVTIKDEQPVTLDVFNAKITGLRIINTCKQDGAPIGGNTFKITTYDGKLVGNYTTNSAGIINVTLEPGTYTIYQTYVDDGYVLNNDVWNVTIKAGVGSTLEVQNEKESGITVHVIDKETGKGIYNVTMEIKDSTNNYVGRFTTDNEGYVYLTDILDAGRYKVTLLNVPDGYTMDTVPKTIVVKTGETTELVWKLTGIQGQVTVVTYAGEDSTMMQIRKNNTISGAVYQIINLSGNVVATISGDSNGEAHSGALPIGTYFIQMVTPPTGFQLNSTRLTVNVTSKNDNLRVEVYCKAAVYNMTISAHGQSTAVAGSTVKYYFTDIANNSTSAMDNFYVHIKLPTDCMRAITLYTGTYNYQTYYNIEYKTNLNDYRTLAQGVNSKNNLGYDLSSRSLALGTNEYVTDVRMVFPNVIAGFKGSMAPTLECQVLATAPSGYQAVMRCDVGGQNVSSGSWSSGGYTSTGGTNAAGSWNAGASTFTTYIYGYPTYYPSTLPKTGY